MSALSAKFLVKSVGSFPKRADNDFIVAALQHVQKVGICLQKEYNTMDKDGCDRHFPKFNMHYIPENENNFKSLNIAIKSYGVVYAKFHVSQMIEKSATYFDKDIKFCECVNANSKTATYDVLIIGFDTANNYYTVVHTYFNNMPHIMKVSAVDNCGVFKSRIYFLKEK